MNHHVMFVGRYCQLFKETGNPAYAWKAIENARGFGYPIPEDVLDYLWGVAHEIIGIANAPPAPAQRPVAIAKALGLHKDGAGQGSPFTDYNRRLRDREMAIETAKKLDFYGPGKADYAFDDVAREYGTSKTTVRRNYRTHLNRWGEVAQMLIDADRVSYGPGGEPQMFTVGTADDLGEASLILKEVNRIKEAI